MTTERKFQKDQMVRYIGPGPRYGEIGRISAPTSKTRFRVATENSSFTSPQDHLEAV
jgi:hypothetical protein